MKKWHCESLLESIEDFKETRTKCSCQRLPHTLLHPWTETVSCSPITWLSRHVLQVTSGKHHIQCPIFCKTDTSCSTCTFNFELCFTKTFTPSTTPKPSLPPVFDHLQCAKAKGECLWIFHTQPLATPWSYMMYSLDMFSTHDVVLCWCSSHLQGWYRTLCTEGVMICITW